MEIGVIAIAIWIISIIGYVIWNLFRKNRRLEYMVINQQVFIENIKESMKQINVAADQIDSKIWVQSDPEFLSLMENVKVMQAKINEFLKA
jgi:hypothetical protein